MYGNCWNDFGHHLYPAWLRGLLRRVAFLPVDSGRRAVVLGSIGMMRDQNRKGLGVAGLVCGLVGLLITLICFACVGCAICQYGGLMRLGSDLANELAAYGY